MYPYLGLRIAPSRYPNVTRWTGRLRERPSFARTLSAEDRKRLTESRTQFSADQLKRLASLLVSFAEECGEAEAYTETSGT